VGSGVVINKTGPAAFLSYALAGVLIVMVMRMLGEMATADPQTGSFSQYARKALGGWAGFSAAWLYWYFWVIVIGFEAVAGAKVITYWFDAPLWLLSLVLMLLMTATNLFSVSSFGEFEFWASVLKVTAIVVFLLVGTFVVVFGVDIAGHSAGFGNLWNNPGGFWPSAGDYAWYGPILVMSGVVFAYASIEMVGVAAGEMKDPDREVPKAVNAVIFRIAVFYCGSILLLVSMLPTTEYTAGTSPFVTVFERLGLSWMGTLIQAVLIVAAMSSLNSGLYATGRVLRSLGMSKQAPAFTLKMSSQGVPWAGIVMTSVVYVFGALLNALAPDAFEIALEAAAIGVVFTWATIFVCQIRLRQLSDRGVIPPSAFKAPGSPWTSIIGLAFLGLVVIGLAVSGWQSSPYFWHKTSFLVVALGIPVIAVVLWIGWIFAKPKVMASTGGQIQSLWTNDGPRYGAAPPTDRGVVPDEDPVG